MTAKKKKTLTAVGAVALAAVDSAADVPEAAAPDEDKKIWARCEPNRSVPICLCMDR